MSKYNKYFYAIFLALAACANPLPPSGGPEDKTPPAVVETYPASGAKNFSDNEVRIEFSKYMNRTQVVEGVFITPTVEYETDWSGRTLEISFKDALEKNVTYAVNLGADYSDYYGNKPATAHTIVFSTGERIDSGRVRGTLFDDDPSGVYIFAYRIDEIDADTLDVRVAKPRFRTQVGSSGAFEINALKDGVYRVFAVRDKFKDGIYDEGVDGFAAAQNDVEVAGGESDKIKLRIGPPLDRIGPALFSAEALFATRLRLRFSEKPARKSLGAGAFIVEDTLKTEEIGVLASYSLPEDETMVDVILAEPPDSSKKWLVRANASEYGVRDTLDNPVRDTLAEAYFYPSAKRDTLAPFLLEPPVQDSSTNIQCDGALEFRFNTAVEKDLRGSVNLLSLADVSEIEFNAKWLADNIFELEPLATLQPNAWFELRYNLAEIRGVAGATAPDTLVVLRFQTEDNRNYPRVKGTLADSAGCESDFVIKLYRTKGKETYSQTLSTPGEWSFEKVKPGAYNIEVFCDEDRDGEYSFGNSFPHKFSERFMISGETIKLKPRWDVEDAQIIFK